MLLYATWLVQLILIKVCVTATSNAYRSASRTALRVHTTATLYLRNMLQLFVPTAYHNYAASYLNENVDVADFLKYACRISPHNVED